jgi:hypothetical protein
VGAVHSIILARHAVTPMTAGLPPASDAPLQRSELARSATTRSRRPEHELVGMLFAALATTADNNNQKEMMSIGMAIA